MVEAILAAKPDLSIADDQGRTPLYLAVMNNDEPIFDLLVNAGAQVDGKDKNGYSLLHQAAQSNNLEAVNQLLHFGIGETARRTAQSWSTHKRSRGTRRPCWPCSSVTRTWRTS